MEDMGMHRRKQCNASVSQVQLPKFAVDVIRPQIHNDSSTDPSGTRKSYIRSRIFSLTQGRHGHKIATTMCLCTTCPGVVRAMPQQLLLTAAEGYITTLSDSMS